MEELELEFEGGGVMLAGREVRMTVAEVVVWPCESVVVIAVTRMLEDEREEILPEELRIREDDARVLPMLLVDNTVGPTV